MIINLFKNDNHECFIRAFRDAAASEGRKIELAPPPKAQARDNGAVVGWCATTDTVSSIFVDAPCAGIMSKISEGLQAPCIDVFFQQHSFWEFSLRYEGLLRINFSVAPEEWGRVHPEWYVGTAEELAELWGVPVQHIERYMVDWQSIEVWSPEVQMMTRSYRLKGEKAYPNDKYAYGDMLQGLDFIRALGGQDPQEGQKFWLYE
jgi:hypothetical protein